jgi:plasmid stabilization system protein ParE
LKLRYSPQAAADIRAAVTWWRANRPAARGLLREELRRATRMLKLQPELGVLALDADLQGARRYLLSGTRYNLYYRVNEKVIEVIRLWHTSREAPRL